MSRPRKKHGESYPRTAEYEAWKSMMRRCTTPTNAAYRHYGGRGITVCSQWHDYEQFLADVGRRPSPELTIERIDNNGNYEPGNVKWATVKEQGRNRRTNRFITWNGRTQCLIEWAIELGVTGACLHRRLQRGRTLDGKKQV